MSLKSKLQSIPLFLTLATPASAQEITDFSLLGSEDLLKYAQVIYNQQGSAYPDDALYSALELCYDSNKSQEIRAEGCHASFLLEWSRLREYLPYLDFEEFYTTNINSENICNQTTRKEIRQYQRELRRIRMSMPIILTEGWNTIMHYHASEMDDRTINKIGIMIHEAQEIEGLVEQNLSKIDPIYQQTRSCRR